jgi:hypothetical protein
VIAIDHVLEEYGVSEQEFVSTWLVSDPRIQGDGNTFEEAIQDLFGNIDFKREMWKISDTMKDIKGTTPWYNPTIGAMANG